MENSKIFMLEEMIDEIQKSLENITNVKSEQQFLIDTLSSLDATTVERFNTLINDLTSQLTQLETQFNTLSDRQLKLKHVCEICHNNEEADVVVNELLEGLGVFSE